MPSFGFNLDPDFVPGSSDSQSPSDQTLEVSISATLTLGSVCYHLQVGEVSVDSEAFLGDIRNGVIARRDGLSVALEGLSVVGGEFLD